MFFRELICHVFSTLCKVLGKDFSICQVNCLQGGKFGRARGDHLIPVRTTERAHEEIILHQGCTNGGSILFEPGSCLLCFFQWAFPWSRSIWVYFARRYPFFTFQQFPVFISFQYNFLITFSKNKLSNKSGTSTKHFRIHFNQVFTGFEKIGNFVIEWLGPFLG